jgi:extradiol dioxygenase family protein
MRDQLDVCHVAVPAYDLAATEEFYVGALGCRLARRYPDRITLDFFGDQLVCHLTDPPSVRRPLDLYPRHFGVTFRRSEDFDLRKIPFFHPVGVRFAGMAEKHRTVVIRDPSDNLIEFKHYNDPRMMY